MKAFLKSQIILIVISWFILFCFIYCGGVLFSKQFKIFIIFYYWIPGLIALYFLKKEKLRIPVFKMDLNKFFLAVGLVLFFMTLTAFFNFPFSEMRSAESLKILFPSFIHKFSPVNMLTLVVLLWIAGGILFSSTIHLFVFFGHELMFSGYAWEKIGFLGFWRASWIIGLYRGICFAPLVLLGLAYPETPLLGILLTLIFCILTTPIKIYLRIVSKGIICPAFFYGFLFHCTNLFPYFFKSKNSLLYGVEGFTGLLALFFINLIIFLKTRKTTLLEYEL